MKADHLVYLGFLLFFSPFWLVFGYHVVWSPFIVNGRLGSFSDRLFGLGPGSIRFTGDRLVYTLCDGR
jgi:hypothetical protein